MQIRNTKVSTTYEKATDISSGCRITNLDFLQLYDIIQKAAERQ